MTTKPIDVFEKEFISTFLSGFDLSDSEAKRVFSVFRARNLIKFDLVEGAYRVLNSSFLNEVTIKRAASL